MDCTKCKEVKRLSSMVEALQSSLAAERAAGTAQLGRTIKRDTDIINGLLREIDALHLLLEKQGNNGNESGGNGDSYIRNCQDMTG